MDAHGTDAWEAIDAVAVSALEGALPMAIEGNVGMPQDDDEAS